MSDKIWNEVDVYIEERLVAEDEALSAAVRLSRKGAVIIVDDVIRRGAVIDPGGTAQVQGVRRMMEQIHGDRRVAATAVQTVGAKGYDGFLMAVVL